MKRLTQNCQRIIRYRKYCSAIQSAASLTFRDGSYFLTLQLPSKKEKVHFGITLPSQTVSDLSANIKREDEAVNSVEFFASDGIVFSQTTSIHNIIQSNFSMKINGSSINIDKSGVGSSFESQTIKLQEISKMLNYLNLFISSHDDAFESVKKQLTVVKTELEPLEQQKQTLLEKAERRTRYLLWLGLGSMGAQAGFLGRLVWCEYSWDIMEPVSYFVTYTAVIGSFAYFIITRKQYEYDDAQQRIFDDKFYKLARKSNFDVEKYEKLKLQASLLESKLNYYNALSSKTNADAQK